ncbi:MAG: D-alanyl-D-alanine carboxypeptidase, partial [Sphingomonadales bacterium]|nr:D-alanyl-D-alanine carboxypeptidase [Sphingomonadales bacterium]
DLTRLAQAMLTRFPQYYRTYIGKPGMTWNGITQPNHDPTLGVIPGADGIKTGFTNEAGYNFLGSATRDGRRLIMVIAHMPNGKERARVSRALLDWGFAAWESRRIYPAGRILADAEVQQGDAASVGLETAQAIDMTMPRGVTAPVKARVRYNGPLVAPIAKGQEVAILEVRVGQQPPAEVPLVASADVARVDSVAARLRAGLSGLLR